MSACVSKNLGLSSSLKMEEEEAMVTKKQGIVSILGSDSDKSSKGSAVNSLRRTLSADMSSKTWLSQNGFLSPVKKIESSAEFSISEPNLSPEEQLGGGEKEQMSGFDLWAEIQENKNKNKEVEKEKGQFDIWSLILSQKTEEQSKPLPPPYVHPQVKRSSSSLSEKSLEICTESLGSETGSDKVSSHPPSENGDMEEDKEDDNGIQDQQEPQKKEEEKGLRHGELIRFAKYNCLDGKKPSQRSLPPPIPSLACQDGASTYMKTHRDNGRVVLEAVSVPLKNNFQAKRQNGRLVLTLANSNENDQEEERNQESREKREIEDLEEEFGSSESEKDEEETQEELEIDEEEEEKRGMSFMMEQAPKFSSGLMSFHRLALVVNKPMGMANRNSTWPNKFNEIVRLKDEEDVEDEEETVVVVEKPKPPTLLAKSLPPRPRPAGRLIPTQSTPPPSATVASFNPYEYYWRPKPISKASFLNNPIGKSNSSSTNKVTAMEDEQQQQQFVVLRRNKIRGGGEELVTLSSKGCKEQRRSLLFWEPYCIATS